MSGSTSKPPGPQWFALHTLSGKEGKVKQYIDRYKTIEELDDFITEVLLPTETVSEVKLGKKSTIVRKLIPGYVFIHMKLFDENGTILNKPWYFIRETTGVIGFVGWRATFGSERVRNRRYPRPSRGVHRQGDAEGSV